MEQPTTLAAEIRKVVADAKEPISAIEIFGKCKFASDQQAVNVALFYLVKQGDVKKAGEIARIGSTRPLQLYASGGGKAKAKKERKPRKAAAQGPRLVRPKRPDKKRAKKSRRSALRSRSVVVRKVHSSAAVLPAEPMAPGFRCGIFSDGSMDLERAGEFFQMSHAELRVVIDYLQKTLPEPRT